MVVAHRTLVVTDHHILEPVHEAETLLQGVHIVEVQIDVIVRSQSFLHLRGGVLVSPDVAQESLFTQFLLDELAESKVQEDPLLEMRTVSDVVGLDVQVDQVDLVHGQQSRFEIDVSLALLEGLVGLAVLHAVLDAVSIHENVKAKLPQDFGTDFKD